MDPALPVSLWSVWWHMQRSVQDAVNIHGKLSLFWRTRRKQAKWTLKKKKKRKEGNPPNGCQPQVMWLVIVMSTPKTFFFFFFWVQRDTHTWIMLSMLAIISNTLYLPYDKRNMQKKKEERRRSQSCTIPCHHPQWIYSQTMLVDMLNHHMHNQDA